MTDAASPTSGAIVPQLDLLIRARAAGFGIAVLDEVLRTRRIHDDNMTPRHGPSKADLFASVRSHLRDRR